MARPAERYFWAVRGLTCQIHRGEVVGIIGRNGSGKTTLLKILSRITAPSEGEARIRGRVGSLLEVGTGFHPELSGRENIFLNGAILGMTSSEIRARFDEIVTFAGVEAFVETPVKHYSSGMHTRLAFSVAAHFSPDILLVDEVLAVGDIEFQRRCLNKMEAVSHEGRTVLLVSHQMNQVRRLCGRTMWLDRGELQAIGPTAEVIGAYESSLDREADAHRHDDENVGGARFFRWRLRTESDTDDAGGYTLASDGQLTVTFEMRVSHPIRHGHHSVLLYTQDHRLVWGVDTRNVTLDPGVTAFVYTIPGLPLRPGAYFWRVNLWADDEEIDTWDATPELLITTQPVTHSMDEWAGVLNVPYKLEIQRLA